MRIYMKPYLICLDSTLQAIGAKINTLRFDHMMTQLMNGGTKAEFKEMDDTTIVMKWENVPIDIKTLEALLVHMKNPQEKKL